MNIREKYQALLSLVGVSDAEVRALIQRADDQALPHRGRTLYLPLGRFFMGDLYGHNIKFDPSAVDPRIEVKVTDTKTVQ